MLPGVTPRISEARRRETNSMNLDKTDFIIPISYGLKGIQTIRRALDSFRIAFYQISGGAGNMRKMSFFFADLTASENRGSEKSGNTSSSETRGSDFRRSFMSFVAC